MPANVWDDLESDPKVAALLSVRSDLLRAVQQAVEGDGRSVEQLSDEYRLPEDTLGLVVGGSFSELGIEELVKIGSCLGVRLMVAPPRDPRESTDSEWAEQFKEKVERLMVDGVSRSAAVQAVLDGEHARSSVSGR